MDLDQVQTTNPNPNLLSFAQESDTFYFQVTYKPNNLSLVLKDYVNWIIYSKDYTEDDIGKQIHKKMDLVDVYNVLLQTRNQCDEETMQNWHENKEFRNRYQFGTIYKSGNIPCFKIQADGRITVYFSIYEKNTKKEQTFQSNLILAKVRNMTQKEIQARKLVIENMEIRIEVEKHKRQREELLQKISHLQQQVIETKQELRTTKLHLTQQINLLQSQIKTIKLHQVQNIKTTKQQIQQIQAQLNASVQSSSSANHKKQIGSQNSIKEEESGSVKGNKVKMQQDEKKEDDQDCSKSWAIKAGVGFEIEACMNLPQFSTSLFKKAGNILELASNERKWTQYIFNRPIHQDELAEFEVKILLTQKKYILVGVVDYEKRKNERCSHASGGSMCYLGFNGEKRPYSLLEGGGFTQGDTVKVQVNRSTQNVKYLINGILKAQHNHEMLAGHRIFMPYIEMLHAKDVIEFRAL